VSEYEHWKGTLKRVIDKTAEQLCKEYYGVTELKDYYSDWEDALSDLSYKDGFVIIDGDIYTTDLQEQQDVDDFFAIGSAGELNEDGSISVHVRFYNGGCSLNDALRCALEDAESKEE